MYNMGDFERTNGSWMPNLKDGLEHIYRVLVCEVYDVAGITYAKARVSKLVILMSRHNAFILSLDS